jgi:hypothetical protein
MTSTDSVMYHRSLVRDEDTRHVKEIAYVELASHSGIGSMVWPWQPAIAAAVPIPPV